MGPVEQEEEVLKIETIQRDAGTHRASRHFRNFWHHFPDGFDEFAGLVERTWPGMEIERPERSGLSSKLLMFCREKRITRELFWSGFGFQIWCQLLTHISRAEAASLLIVDEPEVYLHPDVQRQLLEILRSIGPDILLATHSAEVIGDADPSEIAVIDKSKRAAERLRDIEGVQVALSRIGSIHNISLARLAKNRRVLFVEGEDDFRILRRLAKVLGLNELASGVDITPVVSEGFSSWERISSLGWGIEKALGQSLRIAVIYDRDYWSEEEVAERLSKLRKSIDLPHVLGRKEIENYLLVPAALERALKSALNERQSRGEATPSQIEPICESLERITAELKAEVQGQYVSKRTDYLRRAKADTSTVTTETIIAFERKWEQMDSRLEIVPGKTVLQKFREEIQVKYGITLTDHRITASLKPADIPSDMISLLNELDAFRSLSK